MQQHYEVDVAPDKCAIGLSKNDDKHSGPLSQVLIDPVNEGGVTGTEV